MWLVGCGGAKATFSAKVKELRVPPLRFFSINSRLSFARAPSSTSQHIARYESESPGGERERARRDGGVRYVRDVCVCVCADRVRLDQSS